MEQREYFGHSIVDMAYEIIDMKNEINSLRAENERLRDVEKQYTKLLDDSLNHGKAMAGNMLKCLLTPGVVENLANADTFKS